eukprot:gene57319-biopygen58108
MLAVVYNFVRRIAPGIAHHLPKPLHLLRVLRTADPFAGDDEYTPPPWRRPFLTRVDPTWKSLGSVGCLKLTQQQLHNAFDISRLRGTTEPPPPPKVTAMTDATQSFLIDMLSSGLITKVDPVSHPPTGTLHIIPKNASKSRAVLDARPLNHSQRFIFHIGDHQRANAYRINTLAFGWDAAPFIAQSISEDIFSEVTLGTADFDALVYMDDGLTIAYDTTTSAQGHNDCVAAIHRNDLIPHATKTRGDPSHNADWLGKSISAVPPTIGPSTKSATSAIAATVLAVSSALSMKDRQVVTGSLTWLGIQHRCHLPFLGPAHRFRPPRRGRGVLPARSALSVVAAAAIGTLPWVGQGPFTSPAHRPTMTVYFDGVCIPSRGAFAAAFVPPGLAVLTPVEHADQQHAELVALLLALHLAASKGSTQCTLIGDSTSALHSSLKMSCPSNIPHRSVALRQLSHIVLSAQIGYSVQYIPGKYNPADPISRAIPPASAPVPWVLPSDHPAVRERVPATGFSQLK